MVPREAAHHATKPQARSTSRFEWHTRHTTRQTLLNLLLQGSSMPRKVLAFEVPGYLFSLVAEVDEKTGYPVALTEEGSLGYDAITRFATPDQPYHEVSFDPDLLSRFLYSGVVRQLISVPRDVGIGGSRAALPNDLSSLAMLI